MPSASSMLTVTVCVYWGDCSCFHVIACERMNVFVWVRMNEVFINDVFFFFDV